MGDLLLASKSGRMKKENRIFALVANKTKSIQGKFHFDHERAQYSNGINKTLHGSDEKGEEAKIWKETRIPIQYQSMI